MKASELRQLSLEELNTKVRNWEEELFRSKIKLHTSEIKDTSQFRKLRVNIARGKLVLSETNKTQKPEDKVATTNKETK